MPNESAQRVDVTIDGKPFTSYIWPTTLKKPVLYPIRTATGTVVTRGYPLEPSRAARRIIRITSASWFNHGDVNDTRLLEQLGRDPGRSQGQDGHDRPSEDRRREERRRPGRADGRERMATKPDGSDAARENAPASCSARTGTSRTIDRITTLTALGERVVFNSNKEGVIGMRVTARARAAGHAARCVHRCQRKASATKVLDNTGVTGTVTSSEGLKGDAVWGTRGRWTMLTGTVESEPVTLVMLDASVESRFPHILARARLRSLRANPMGEEVFTEGKKELNVTGRAERKSIEFRHRILILRRPGHQPTRSSGSYRASHRVRRALLPRCRWGLPANR